MNDDGVQITFNGADLHAGLMLFRSDAVKIVRASLRRSVNELYSNLSGELPRRTGRLINALHVRTRAALGRNIVKAVLVVDTKGKAGDADNAFYWRFVEFGHLTRPSKDPGHAQHMVPGSGAIQRQWAVFQQLASSRFYSDLATGLNKRYTRESRQG